MERITLMYHDVLNSLYPKSGFQKVGALQYAIESRTLDEHLNFATGVDNVQFSFDDGGSSFYDVIAPMLEHYKRKGIFYIATSYIGTEFFMTEDQIRELDRRGHVIASHSHSHPKKISELSREECLKEWRTSKHILEEIVGHDITVASVPGGAVSDMVIDCMIEAGYRTIYTSEPTTVVAEKNGAKIYGRFGVKKETSFELYKQILTNPKHRKKMLQHHNMLGFAKRIFGSHYNEIKQIILKIKRRK